MAQSAPKMARGVSQLKLFFELQMAAHNRGRHFAKRFSQSEQFFHLQMAGLL